MQSPALIAMQILKPKGRGKYKNVTAKYVLIILNLKHFTDSIKFDLFMLFNFGNLQTKMQIFSKKTFTTLRNGKGNISINLHCPTQHGAHI